MALNRVHFGRAATLDEVTLLTKTFLNQGMLPDRVTLRGKDCVVQTPSTGTLERLMDGLRIVWNRAKQAFYQQPVFHVTLFKSPNPTDINHFVSGQCPGVLAVKINPNEAVSVLGAYRN